jgi:hypothetical protein
MDGFVLVVRLSERSAPKVKLRAKVEQIFLLRKEEGNFSWNLKIKLSYFKMKIPFYISYLHMKYMSCKVHCEENIKITKGKL